MTVMTSDAVFSGMPDGIAVEPFYWKLPNFEEHLRVHHLRAYARGLDRSKYGVEFHGGEQGLCGRFSAHDVFHDTRRSFVITYDDLPLGIIGFQDSYFPHLSGKVIEVTQIQGIEYALDERIVLPSKSISWHQAGLNLAKLYSEHLGAEEIDVNFTDFWGSGKRKMYETTALNCGFTYDEQRGLWRKSLKA